VMRVNHIERPDVVLTLEQMMDKGPAHVVDFIHKIGLQVERTAMVMDAVNPLVMRLPRPHSREDMDLMTLSFESCPQFGHMYTHAAHTNRMQRLPRQHCDSHFSIHYQCANARWQEGTFDG